MRETLLIKSGLILILCYFINNYNKPKRVSSGFNVQYISYGLACYWISSDWLNSLFK